MDCTCCSCPVSQFVRLIAFFLKKVVAMSFSIIFFIKDAWLLSCIHTANNAVQYEVVAGDLRKKDIPIEIAMSICDLRTLCEWNFKTLTCIKECAHFPELKNCKLFFLNRDLCCFLHFFYKIILLFTFSELLSIGFYQN